MTLAQLVPIVLQVSVGLAVFSIALQAHQGDLSYLLRKPSLLFRSLLAMNFVMPALAVATAVLFNLRPEVETALILLAIAPVPPVLPGKQRKAGGNVSYGIGLLTISAIAAIVTVPASIELIARVMGRDIHVPVGLIFKIVGITVLAPLMLGALVRRMAPALAERLARPLSRVGSVLLLVGVIPMFAAAWPGIMGLVGEYSLAAIVSFTVVGLLMGHLLGGPDPGDRTVLALSTATRHPGVALALSGIVAHGHRGLAAAVLLSVLVVAIVTFPYMQWRKRADAAVGVPAVQGEA